MAKRFPLVIDYDDNNKIIELPAGDCLNLENSEICNVGNITINGGKLTIDGENVSTFSGFYNDLFDLPSIPETLIDLDIVDGDYDQVLHTDGKGHFRFRDVLIDYNSIKNLPDIPDSILDLGIVDGVAGSYLSANGDGTFKFVNLASTLLGTIRFVNNKITTVSGDPIEIEPAVGSYVQISAQNGLVVPVGTDTDRGSSWTGPGAIRFNTSILQFEGHYGSDVWNSLGGVRSVDGKTYIIPESQPGRADHTLFFYTNDTERLRITETDAIFDPAVKVSMDTLNVNNLVLHTNMSLNGDIEIGDEQTDTLTINSRVVGSLNPKFDKADDIGKNDLRWRDFYLKGQAYINDYVLPSQDGDDNSILATDGNGNIRFQQPDTWGGNRVYVSQKYGSDYNDGTTLPVRTIRRALELAANMAVRPAAFNEMFFIESDLLKKFQLPNEITKEASVTAPTFTFDIAQFEKDFEAIIQAIRYDAAFDTSYNQIKLGGVFGRRTTPFFTGTSAVQTDAMDYMDSQLAKLFTGSSVKSEFTSGINQIQDVVTGGLSSAPPIAFAQPNIKFSEFSDVAHQLFIDNAVFIAHEINAYFVLNNSSITYIQANLQNTIKELIVAFAYDILYGGNSGTIIELEAHKSDIISIFGDVATARPVYDHLRTVIKNILEEVTITASVGNTISQVLNGTPCSRTEINHALQLVDISIACLDDKWMPKIVYPNINHAQINNLHAIDVLEENKEKMFIELIDYVSDNNNFYNPIKYRKDIQFIIDSAQYDVKFGGNEKSIAAGIHYNNLDMPNYSKAEIITGITSIITKSNDAYTGLQLADFQAKLAIISDILNGNPAPAVNVGTVPITKRIGVIVASGEYVEKNPIVIPDFVSIIGEASVVIRPQYADKDIFRVRNECNIINLTFKDHVDDGQQPDWTWRYAVTIDNVEDLDVDLLGSASLDRHPVIMRTPFTIQNCHAISVLGGNGVEIDGKLVEVLDVPPMGITEELPETGYAGLINGLNVTSFGGNAIRVTNDAKLQAVGCTTAFNEVAYLTQSGGLLNSSNSSSSYGYFNLRSSGKTPVLVDSDKGLVTDYGEYQGLQTIKIIGLLRPAIEHYTIYFNDGVGDVTDDYRSNAIDGVEIGVTPDDVTVTNSRIDFGVPHNFVTGDIVEYDSNGDYEIIGLKNELTYYVYASTPTAISLYHDEDRKYPVQQMNPKFCTKTHYFRAHYEEIYVDSILDTHNVYQDIELPNTNTYTIVEGNTIYGSDGTNPITATISKWDPANFILTVGIELTQVGSNLVRNKFTVGSTIDYGIVAAPSTATILSVTDRDDLFTSNVTINTSRNTLLRALANTMTKGVKLYRPSIINATAHVWNFPGSGVDYNALPQHGGLIDRSFETVDTLPGRVYAQGSNEAGDFRIGRLIESYQRAGRIEFNSKLSIKGLEILAFANANSTPVTFISRDVELGDTENGGPSDSRLVTQLAARTFLDNHLKAFYDKRLSALPEPSAVVQLNSRGQLNPELLSEKSTYTAHIVPYYKGRYDMHLEVPAKDLAAGDIVIEEYDEVVLTLSALMSFTEGEILTQPATGAKGVVKENYTNDNRVRLIYPEGTFSEDITHGIESDLQGPLMDPTSGGVVYNYEVYGKSQRRDNYFINTTIATQYLILEQDTPHSFVSTIGFGRPIYGASSRAVGTPTRHLEGALVAVDNSKLPTGSGYADGKYYMVQLITTTSTGSGALADITVVGGEIVDVDLRRTGEGYETVSVMRVAETAAEVTAQGATFVPTTGIPTPAAIEASEIEERLYVEIDQTVGLHFNASTHNLDFITDDSSQTTTIPNLADETIYECSGYSYDPSLGGVNTIDNTITFNMPHTLSNGDYVIYNANGYPAIGGLVHDQTYYVEVMTPETVRLYYTYGMHPSEIVDITQSTNGNHYFERPVVNTRTNQFYLELHGLATGDPIKITGADLPGNTNDGSFMFVGSITPNTFSVHYARRTALDSVDGAIIASHNMTSSGSGAATLTYQSVIVRDSVNTSGELESSWTTLMKTEIDGDDVVTGTVKARRLGRGIPTDETFLRGDNTWQYAVESIKTTNDTSEVVITGKDHNIGSDKVWHSDINIHVNYASYDDPSAPNVGEETAGIAAFHFDHFEIETGQGLVNTKPSTRGGEIDAKYLDGEDGVYWRNPIHHSRAVPVEWGGTNQNGYTQGDMLYAATDIGDGTYTQVVEKLPIGNNNAILMSNGSVPIWTSTATLTGITVANIQIGITDPNTIDTVPGTGDLILSSDSEKIIFDGNTDTTGNVDIDGNVNIGGDTVSLGSAIYNDIKIGVDYDNMISTQLHDLRIKPITGDTHIESNLTVTDDVLINKNLTVDLNTTINQNLHVVSDTQIDETLTVDLHANIYDIRIGVAQPNEIDTTFGDLVLDSNTGLTIIDDDLRVTQTSTFDSDITITGNITYDGNTTQVGNNTQTGNTDIDGDVTIDGTLRVDELQFGKTVDNEIDTVSTDLILDSATGQTIIDDKLHVTDDVSINSNNVAIVSNTSHLGDSTHTGNATHTGNYTVTGEVYVDDLRFGNTLANEIDTATMDLILDSATGQTIIDDRLTVTDDVVVNANTAFNGNNTHIGDATHQGTTTQTGTTNIIGYLNVDGETRMDDIVVGVTQSFELEAINGQELWLDSAAGLTVVDDDLRVTGNLTVLGAMTTVATTNMVVSDKNIIVADGSGSAMDANGAGLTVDIGVNMPVIPQPTILYDAVDDSWDLNKDVNIEGFKFNSTSMNNTLSGLTSDVITVNTLNSLNSVNVTGTINSTGLITSDTGFATPGTISATGPGYIESVMGFTTPGTIFANGTVTSPGGFVGNADTSSKWFTPRTVFFQDDALGNLTDVNGQFTIDGSGDVMEVVLTIRKEKVQDYIGELIVTDGTHTGITVDYFDNGDGIKGNMNFAIDQPWMWDFTGQMFTANTETGIISTYNQTDRKIEFDINYDEMKDAMAPMLAHTNHYGVDISYDTLNKVLTVTTDQNEFKDTTGKWLNDTAITKGIDVTYDELNKQMTFDVHDPVISISGDAVGSATMTDLGDVDIAVTMITKAVTLGLNTTGDYVEDLVQGDGIFLEFTGGEGSRPKINHANTSTASNVTLTQQPSAGPNYGGGIISFDYVSYMTLDTFGHIADVTVDQLSVYQGYDIQVVPVSDFAAGTVGAQDHIWEDEVKFVAGNKTKITYDSSNFALHWDATDTYLVSATWDAVTGDVTIVQHEDTEIDKTDGTTITTNVLPSITLSIPETLDTLTSRGNITTNAITVGNITNNGTIVTSGNATFKSNVALGDAATDKISFNGRSATHLIPDTDVTRNLGSATLQWNKLYVKDIAATGNVTVTGTVNIDSQTTVASLNVEDLTPTRVVYVGTNGELVNDPDMTFNGTTLSVNSISTAAAVNVGGTLAVTGATTLSSTLAVTGEATLASATVSDLTSGRLVYVGTSGSLQDSANLSFNGTTLTANTAAVTNNATVGGTLGVTGATTLSSTLAVKGNTTLGDSAGTDTVAFNSRVNTAIQPKTDNSHDLGSSSLRWQDFYAMTGTFSGNITNNAATSRYNFTGGYLQGTSTSTVLAFGTTTLNMTANTITPGTDNTYSLGTSAKKFNTVYATTFNGTATAAKYADLAENYVADKEYPAGTVLMFGGEKEVTEAVGPATTKVIGVVSTAPAYLMNSDLEEGTPVALKGRVPCYVVGKVNKGDLLTTSHLPGIAIVTHTWIGGAIIGKAIESSDNPEVKIIEIAVGVL